MKVEGFFANTKLANNTVNELKKAGFDKSVVDMNDHYIDNRNVKTNLAGNETASSLSDLTLGSGSHIVETGKAPLTAASPMASGMGKFEEIADVNCRVVVNFENADEDKVKKIIRDAGGTLENPHIQKPKIEQESEIALHNALKEIDRIV